MRSTIKQLLQSPNVLPQACHKILKELLRRLDEEFIEGGRGFEYIRNHPELKRSNSEA